MCHLSSYKDALLNFEDVPTMNMSNDITRKKKIFSSSCAIFPSFHLFSLSLSQHVEEEGKPHIGRLQERRASH